MANSKTTIGCAKRTRRSLTSAAGLVLTAILALSVRSERAVARDDDDRRCFLRGTRIRTTTGYRHVEDLAVGDFLPTVYGGTCAIQWIGFYDVKSSDQNKPWPSEARPVRIMRSALDDDIPDADLYLTAPHALYIDGVLVPVGNLINGTTITLDEADELDTLEYFHIKLEKHDVIDAQGVLCESLLANDEAHASRGDYIGECGPSRNREVPCAPLLSFNGGRSQVKSRLRSAASIWMDRRQQLDVIRDHLEERAIALCRNGPLPGARNPPPFTGVKP